MFGQTFLWGGDRDRSGTLSKVFQNSESGVDVDHLEEDKLFKASDRTSTAGMRTWTTLYELLKHFHWGSVLSSSLSCFVWACSYVVLQSELLGTNSNHRDRRKMINEHFSREPFSFRDIEHEWEIKHLWRNFQWLFINPRWEERIRCWHFSHHLYHQRAGVFKTTKLHPEVCAVVLLCLISKSKAVSCSV